MKCDRRGVRSRMESPQCGIWRRGNWHSARIGGWVRGGIGGDDSRVLGSIHDYRV